MKLLSTKEVSEILGVQPMSVGRYCKARAIEYVRFGHYRKFTIEAVEDFIARRTVKAIQPKPSNGGNRS